ncbi:ATP-binding protein [Actinoallomurus sp. CA-142502]|uniref:sensor histidine kinase n=1 Tax=Actinoallomurus sp. CA-142502 TaxID=3239885 RepID=UPI003D89D77F
MRGLAPATLRGRLALVALATTASWVALLTVGFNLALHAQLRRQADDLLRTRAAAVAATLQTWPDGHIRVLEPSDDRALDVGVWIYQGHTAIERPRAPRGLQASADRMAGRRKTFMDIKTPHAWRVYSLPVMSEGRRVGTVVSAVDLDPYSDLARLVLAGSAVLALLLLFGVYLLTRAVVRGALRPVTQMSEQAARWGEHGTHQRFGAEHRPAELAGLAGNLDQLLDRLSAVLRHEQQLTAELSHELRTPLAQITAEIDWLITRNRTATERDASHQAIAASAATMQRICESMLTIPTDQVRGRCSPLHLARDLAERNTEGPPIVVTGNDVTAGVPANLVERILLPLLNNARRYARNQITVECTADVEIIITDDGPGVPVELRNAVFEPGRRANPDDGHDGVGLGLALARRLARTADGDIAIDAAGRFVISLPRG